MAQYVESNVKAFELSATCAVYRRVKLDTNGKVLQAGAGEQDVGTIEEGGVSGNYRVVRLCTAAGTRKMVAAGAFSINDVLYPAAAGKVDDAPTGAAIALALEAATADGDIVEVLYIGTLLSQASGDSLEVIGGAGGITALDLVYVSDQTDAIMTVLKAQGTTGGRFADYIVPTAIAAAARGQALKRFLLQGINTSAAGAAGDPVYLSDSAAGGYALAKPSGTDKVQIVGRVVEKHASTGAILFDLSGPQQVVHTHSDASEGGAAFGAHTSDDITLNDGKDIITNVTTGSKIGKAAGQKVGRWGSAPVVQPGHNADPAACAAMTHGAGTGADGTTPAGAEYNLARADIDALKTAVDANKAAIDAINADDAATGLTASA